MGDNERPPDRRVGPRPRKKQENAWAKDPRNQVFGMYLAEKRVAAEMTQGELARAVGMEQSEVSKWERSILRIPPPDKIHAFAAALRHPVELLAIAAAGVRPDADTLPSLVKDTQGQVIPELARLYSLHPTALEARLLVEMLQGYRRWQGGVNGIEV